MDCRAPQAAAPPPAGRKSKAPPPPSETKPVTVSPFDNTESANLIMEQKENVIDKDIELSVVLPGDVIKYTTVNGRKPMMDLLIFLCAQYHLNPSSYTIELLSAEDSQIKFKPNTPVGMLEVEKVILKPKQMDKKKPAPVIPEQTVRVVINYKKTQKTVVRVSPHSPLQDLIPVICSKCEFDPSHTLLLKDYQSQEPLDVTKSLNDLGLRELYAMDISRATSPVDLNLPSFQDSCQSENLDVLKEKENKGFFSFFQRSKKKREQAASAPATPLMSKPRAAFITRSNTVSKQYDSNTLPSEMPKKRRAPLPPMPNSQSAPQELAQAQVRETSDIVKSNSLDSNEQVPPGLVRKGSLPLSDTASVNSSLRRMKRKAPSPPSRAPEDQSQSSNETGVRSPEYSLEEIDEREERIVQQREDSESTNASPGIGEVTAAFSSAEVPLETERNDRASSAPVPGSVSVDNSQSFKEEKQENMSTDGKGLQTMISSEQAAFEKDRKLRILDQNKTDDHSDIELFPTTEEAKELQSAEIKTVDFRENNKLKVDRLSNCQTCKNDISVSHRNYPQMISQKQDEKTNQNSLDTVKTQDVAIQTGPLDSNLGRTTQKEIIVPQGCESSTFRGLVPQHSRDANSPLLQAIHGMQGDEDNSTQQNLERQEATHEKVISVKDQSHICINSSNFASPETTAKTLDDSPIKGQPLYRQDAKPKPKPANEITRDYIPKIGMTTYKIVPPKSLEIMKSWESEIPSDYKDQEAYTLENSLKHEDPKEFIVQAEIPHLPKSVGHLQVGSQNEPAAANYLLHKANSISDHAVVSGAEITTESNQTETESSKHHVPLMLSLDNTNASSETQNKSNALSPTTKPSSFYLQMQRRASSHYVTSAIARSTICAPNSIKNEAKNTEMGKKISSPDPTSPLHKTSTPSPPADEENDDDGKKIESSISHVKSNQPSTFPSCPPTLLNLRTLRTFAVPKPYSSSRPSPFALAVSSAVRRSQSFNKTRTTASQAPREEFPVELSSVASAAKFSATSVPRVQTPSLQTITGGSQNSVMDKKDSNVNSEQKSQAQSGASTDHPPPVTKRQTVMTFQRSDPEQIHQSLLAAIRSGEAAAKLKRVSALYSDKKNGMLPVLILTREKQKDDNILEISSIPNPFPELCCSPFASVLSASLLSKETSRKTQVIKVYSEDDTSRALEVPSDITARDVCQLLILKNHYIDDHSWTLFEQLTHTGLGRSIEDHELVMEVQSNWVMEEENKLYFRKNYAKYEFFKNPLSFFPDHMISFPSETHAVVSHSGILQMFLSSSTYPEIHGYLHAKEQGKKSWKKLYFLLRRSGLYFSTKGTSKEPRHLQFFCEFSNSDMYMSLTGKKISGAPTNYGFCFKPNKSGGTRDLKQLCADDEQSRTCWMTAIRLLKYGMQLYQNYMQPYQGRSGCSPLNITPMRSISENSLVAMDFSGHRSRIIENPTEALSVAVEEGLAWRRRGCLRLNSHGSPIAMSNMAIHRSQSWFHHKISREEAQRLILQHGLVDGVFLVRDSQSNPKTFVLSLSHGLKIKHFQIVPLEDDGKLFYTLDDGHTRFTDLIQLVEFYQLNKGVLPCKLKHYCARIAL